MKTGNQIILFFTLIILPFLANAEEMEMSCALTEAVDPSQSLIDGPYVFYGRDKIIVRSFQVEGTACKVAEEKIYKPTEEVPLICKVDMNGSVGFEFTLKKSHKSPPAVFPQPEKLFAISDIEGNFQAFTATLIGNGVVTKKLKWNYGEGHLVLVGDFFDRGDQVTECLWLIYKLEQEALAAGGRVHFVLGNHEEMNMRGDTRHAVKKYKTVAQFMSIPVKKLYGKNTEFGRWLRTRNIMVKIGTTIFTHGGIGPKFAVKKIPIKKVNAIARVNMGRAMNQMDGVSNIVFAKNGPLWYRGYFDGSIGEEAIGISLQYYDATQVVVGHTVMEEISSLFDGKVIAIDIKHKEKLKNNGFNAITMLDNQIFKVNAFGKKEKLRELQSSSGVESTFKGIKENNLTTVKKFLSSGKDINERFTSKKYTLLHYAIKMEQANVVRFLLDNNADVDLLYDDKTALMHAIKTNNQDIILTILNSDVNVEVQNRRKKTALYYAAKYSTPKIAKMLVNKGASIEHRDYKGRSPLEYAVSNKNIPVAHFLKSKER